MAFTLLTTVAGAIFWNVKLWINGATMYIVASGSVNASALYGGYCDLASCTLPASWTWKVLKNDQQYGGIGVSSTGSKIYAVGQTSVVSGSAV